MMKTEWLFPRLMDKEDQGGGGTDTDPPKNDDPPPKPDDTGDEGEDTLPDDAPDWVKARLSKISQKKNAAIKRAEEAERKLKEQEEADEQAKLDKLKEDGELQKVNDALTEKLEKLEPKAKKFEKMEQGIRDEALKTIADTLGDEEAADYADFETDQLQKIAKGFEKQAAPPAPGSEKPGGRNVDENEAAALQKYGSKPMIARLNPELYRKLYPNPRRRNG